MQIQATRAVADNRATTRPQFAEILDRVRLAPSQRGKDGPPSLAWCLGPVRDVIVDHDSWNVSGLEGTRSKTVVINDCRICAKPSGAGSIAARISQAALSTPLAQGQLPEILKPPSTTSTFGVGT